MRAFVRSCVRHKIFFSLKSPWNHPLTPGVEPRGLPRVLSGQAAPPEELEYVATVESMFFEIMVKIILAGNSNSEV